MNPEIKHLIVLMLENRSFDHMLGYMNYPEFAPHRLQGTEVNYRPDGTAVPVSNNSGETIEVDPGHYHQNVLRQLAGGNQGFVDDYQRVVDASGRRVPQNYGDQIMRCFNPARHTPVLATLAREFAVLPRWFCSVPGATWPNRNYAHCATSAGWVNNPPRRSMPGFLGDRTIFEQLDSAGLERSWNVFRGGSLFQTIGLRYVLRNLRKVKHMESLYQKIEDDELPVYSFIEPVHQTSGNNSQHPYYIGQNTGSFQRGESLISRVYSKLREHREVFDKTLLLITYDEHGGFFDREFPPAAIPPDNQPAKPNGSHDFRFNQYGLRVPSVLVSPRIAARTIDERLFDHTSIIKTARSLFAPHMDSLTKRDETANSFHDLAVHEPRSDLPIIRAPEVEAFDEATISAEHLSEFHEFEEIMIEMNLRLGDAIEEDITNDVPMMEALTREAEEAAPLSERFNNDQDLVDRLLQIDALMSDPAIQIDASLD